MVVIVWQLNLQLPVQLVDITTKVMSSNPVHGDISAVFSGYTFSPYIKTDLYDITEILLKVALHIISQSEALFLWI